MSPTQLPTAPRARDALPRQFLRRSLSSTAAISFSLTFAAGGLALMAGLVPSRFATAVGEIETGVVVLFVPLCALILAIMVEVVRSIMREGVRQAAPRRANPLSAWKPSAGQH